MTSLRRGLLAWLLGLITMIGVLAAAAAYVLDLQEVNESLDEQLRQGALNVGDTILPVRAAESDDAATEPEDGLGVTIWTTAGQSASTDQAFHADRPNTSGYADCEAAGEEWRGYTRFAGERAIQVAQRMVVRDESAAASAMRALLPIAASIPLLWLLVGAVVGR